MNKPIRVATFNIRFDSNALPASEKDNFSSFVTQGEPPWNVRYTKVVDAIIFHRIDLLSIQEALYNQINDLESLLGSDWNWIGVGRDDGKKAGEFVPIFFNKNRLKLLDSKHFWLSEEPDVPGKGWDAQLRRVVTQATFQDLLTNSTFIWINAHFDHGGAKARIESSKLLLNHAKKLKSSSPSTVKVLLSGDLNCEENEEPYKLLTGKNEEDPSTMVFVDARYAISGLKGGSFGFSQTYTGFTKDTSQERIDYILIDKDSTLTQAIKVISHGVLPNLYDDGIYISDHRPVVSDLIIQ